MPKPTKGPRLGGSPAHQRKILANLCKDLFITRRLRPPKRRLARYVPISKSSSRRPVSYTHLTLPTSDLV